METMRAIVCSRYGPPDVLHFESCKKPLPNNGQRFGFSETVHFEEGLRLTKFRMCTSHAVATIGTQD
jgi:hypothetical protein